ncbi:hypothetical protein PAAG_08753 [Paracoccidioides lutzii Pb01]|uniref:C2H2-type domain-containing protein n=1 Tax=Paracoccidioides lutzii (strain ATCC MYA-826 / Pb01) TaxID=502779 RepID=C1HDB2_PARBA|nr:hypothetical protein PAAG_08753 [Paracoccidioides lutzii Pb01]EEH39484.2 hypothetical protein PAAG_08753 [Paracoccidioides lutzii Pb01]
MAQEVPPVVADDSEPRLAARRTREPPKNAGQIYCNHPDCHDHILYFKTPWEWNRHMDKHDRPYKCTNPDCNRRFTQAGSMRRHLITIHQVNSKLRWTHSDCDRSSSRKVDLKKHIHRIHTKPDSIDSLRAEIARLQREAMQRDSRLDKMEMELNRVLSPSVRLPSCAELEAGVAGN